MAFFTLVERKYLGLAQERKGPLKVGVIGIFQPLRDAVKLFAGKNFFKPRFRKPVLFQIRVILGLWLSLFIWAAYEDGRRGRRGVEFRMLFVLVILGRGVYPLLIAGWSSESKYSTLGGVRALAQTLSYEIVLAFFFLIFLCVSGTLKLEIVRLLQRQAPLIFLTFPLVFVWLVCILAEVNRTPFDFGEGEREIVSGFNTEYRAGFFALVFIAEYRIILFIRGLRAYLFVVVFRDSYYRIGLIITRVALFLVWIRGSFPRFRYDKLIKLTWERLLPLSLVFLVLFLSYKIWFIVLGG